MQTEKIIVLGIVIGIFMLSVLELTSAFSCLHSCGVSAAENLSVSAGEVLNILTNTGPITITPGLDQNLNIILKGIGDFTVNVKDLFIDTSEGNVGIGTDTPNDKLTVDGAIRLIPQSSSICNEEHIGAIYYNENDNVVYICKNNGWNEYSGPQGPPGQQGPPGTNSFSINEYNCNSIKSKLKTCVIGSHMFCYLSGYETEQAKGLCKVSGDINNNWKIIASKANCDAICIEG